MALVDSLREALEAQVLDREATQAAQVLRDAVQEWGAVEVADGLLDSAAVALRRMVAETDEALLLDEVVEELTLNGTVPDDSADLLGHMLTQAAATAGGVRSTVQKIVDQIGPERVMWGAWLATLSTIRVVAIRLERTESDVVDELLLALQHF
jgi:hypothetical protein